MLDFLEGFHRKIFDILQSNIFISKSLQKKKTNQTFCSQNRSKSNIFLFTNFCAVFPVFSQFFRNFFVIFPISKFSNFANFQEFSRIFKFCQQKGKNVAALFADFSKVRGRMWILELVIVVGAFKGALTVILRNFIRKILLIWEQKNKKKIGKKIGKNAEKFRKIRKK